MRIVCLLIGCSFIALLVWFIVDDSTKFLSKPVFGAGWGAAVFLGYYFALTREKKWATSPEFAAVVGRYSHLIRPGEDVRSAEEQIGRSMKIENVASGVRSVPNLGIRKIRVSIFSDADTELRIYSHDGRVFGGEVRPQKKNG